MSTPAWTFRRNFDRTGEYEIFDGEKPVAIVLNREDGVHDEEIARLIAAAPDLLKALQAAYKTAVDHDESKPFDWATYCEMLHQAITKATGGEA